MKRWTRAKKARCLQSVSYTHLDVYKRQLRKPPDFTIFFTVLILSAFGLVMVFSASYITALESRGDAFFFLRRQAFWVGLGLIGMIFTANFNYWKWRRMVPLLLLLNFLLLLLVFIPGVGMEYGGARRWISLGSLTVQPAELDVYKRQPWLILIRCIYPVPSFWLKDHGVCRWKKLLKIC